MIKTILIEPYTVPKLMDVFCLLIRGFHKIVLSKQLQPHFTDYIPALQIQLQKFGYRRLGTKLFISVPGAPVLSHQSYQLAISLATLLCTKCLSFGGSIVANGIIFPHTDSPYLPQILSYPWTFPKENAKYIFNQQISADVLKEGTVLPKEFFPRQDKLMFYMNKSNSMEFGQEQINADNLLQIEILNQLLPNVRTIVIDKEVHLDLSKTNPNIIKKIPTEFYTRLPIFFSFSSNNSVNLDILNNLISSNSLRGVIEFNYERIIITPSLFSPRTLQKSISHINSMVKERYIIDKKETKLVSKNVIENLVLTL